MLGQGIPGTDGSKGSSGKQSLNWIWSLQLIDTVLEQETDCIVAALEGDAADALGALDALPRVLPGHIGTSVDDAKPIRTPSAWL